MESRNQVSVPGVMTLGWGRHKETTYVGALESALSVTDRPYRYEELMAVSGLAFRIRWWRGVDGEGQQFCPSSPVGEFKPEINRLGEAIGWEQSVDVRFGRPNGQYGFEDTLPRIQASIDAGVPVLCYGKNMDVSVVYGYVKNSDDLILMDYCGIGDQETVMSVSQIGPLVICFGEKTAPCEGSEWLKRALLAAVENWENKGLESKKPGKYFLGERAILKWIEDLEMWENMDIKHRREMFHPHWWTFSCLYDARRAAVSFLKDQIEKDESKLANELKPIADIYQKEECLLSRTFQKKDLFLGPWTGRQFEEWDSQVRFGEVKTFREFLILEDQAISMVKRILDEI
jgi:hypothetical protein